MIVIKYVRKVLWLLLVGLLLPLSGSATAVDTKFDVLHIKADVYTNVTVTTVAKDFICITHSRGMGSIKVEDLPDEAKERLGYIVPEKNTGPGFGADMSAQMKKTLDQVNLASVEPLQKAWTETAAKGFLANTPARNLLLGVLGAMLVAYVIFCFCAKLICDKTGKKPGFLIWVPVLQWLPLLKAAGMPPGWFLLMLVPVVNLVAYVVWCVKITRARAKHGFAAFLLMLPGLNMLAFLYLALSASTAVTEEAKPKAKFVSPIMTLEGA